MDYQELGIRPVVSAQGNSTPLGSAILTEGVLAAMASAARCHVNIDELWDAAGRFLASVTGTEDACPTTGAAAGMAIAVAACIAGSDLARIQRLPDSTGLRNEVVLQKGQSISYGGALIGQMIALGGGRAIETGSVNETLQGQVVACLSERTTALVYVTSQTHAVHRNSVPIEQIVEIGRSHGIPVIVDAASEEDLRSWAATGADLVIYSGPKVMAAPTAGFVCGRANLIAACRAQSRGIARPMKVGKENLLGLLEAVREHTSESRHQQVAAQRSRMAALVPDLSSLPGISARVIKDESGREIYRVLLTIDPETAGCDAAMLARQLAAGTPAVYMRDFKAHRGQLEIDPRALGAEAEDVIVRRLKDLLLPTALTKF